MRRSVGRLDVGAGKGKRDPRCSRRSPLWRRDLPWLPSPQSRAASCSKTKGGRKPFDELFLGWMDGWMDDLAKTNLLAYHIFTEPDPSAGIDIDADADTMQGRAEKVDTVPAAERLVSHTLLHRIHPVPGGRIGPCSADTFSAVAQTREAFIRDALVRRAAIRAGVAEAAMRHAPAMSERNGGLDVVSAG